MIGKAKSVAHSGNSLSYAMNKKDAEIIDSRYVSGETPQQVQSEFKTFQDLNSNCTNNTFSFVVSPNKADNLSNDQMKEIANKFLQKMGLSENQSIIIKHVENKNKIPHLHIYTNRINMEGQAAPDWYIGKDASRAADQVAQEMNLTRARIIQEQKELAQKPIKKQVQKIFDEALKRSKNPSEFFKNVESKGVKIERSIDKKGNTRGYRAIFKGESLKASTIGNKFTLAKIGNAITTARSLIDPTSLITKGITNIVKGPSQGQGI